MNEEQTKVEFDKADQIIAVAIENLIDNNISPYIYGMAFLELGLAALARTGESEDEILKSIEQLMNKAKRLHTRNKGH